MRLVTFHDVGEDRSAAGPGLLISDDVVLDLRDTVNGAGPLTAVDVLIDPTLREQAREVCAVAQSGGRVDGQRLAMNRVRLLSPVKAPEKILCIGLNYRSHADEAGMEAPKAPAVFAKFNNAIVGSGEPIRIPEVSRKIDWEGELAVVIGRTARSVDPTSALDYIAGYTVINDVTARDLQFLTSQWTLGKSCDTFAPIGPCVVDVAAVPDPGALRIETRVNGVVKQSAAISEMIFSVPTLVAELSAVMTLSPGDIIATGTPDGIGASRKPREWLKHGDIVEVMIDEIGTLRNPVEGPENRQSGPQ